MKTQLTAIMKTYSNSPLTDYIKPQKFFMPFEYIDDQECSIKCTNEGHIKIDVEILLGKSCLEGDFTPPFTRENVEYLIFREEFYARIYDINFAMQIANPGKVAFNEVLILQDGKPCEYLKVNPMTPPYVVEYTFDEEINPKVDWIETFDWLVVWDWLREIPDFWREVAQSNIGRVFNYLRYFYNESSPLGIVWLSMSLESLLVTNQSFSKNQLAGKLTLLLHDIFDKKYIVSNVEDFYKLRSKIVHGKQNLSRPSQIHYTSETESIDDKFLKIGSFGYLSLLYCLQFMINEGINELNIIEEIIYRFT
ncbi:HEPN domain-containing protein [Aneurinibacillus aneurinilyticus]|uniref:Uncharacterized protein n=1 Tax=Aneurinibacillus aneurinilyticus ATCC 12856 TaxID=649747 RepID=U1WTW7_ANEAE|nr:HEPN domain-containing protein [Aneurinibacillus aneurinilyticus]ERI05688.1 hypothetical protein HMPREF0083_05535 [Aneurinibacillus aneurinilyticus ATCC 12856]MED0708926.1 HEPN domain-containing protein [Aneurinibacillus aneurinilyticus]MED0722901.1 HEPN domain-containing protein [Aneurinibacillus aneurinilyticus]MED0732598.1 HEPN domain-containing protein [Aneurinibacillus aneurinilyticus]MED0740675.1 HEPN domain-containing protein [Aneurinibacillus aneurinilyticus]